jgi:exopolysaccharide biosynthesis protein
MGLGILLSCKPQTEPPSVSTSTVQPLPEKNLQYKSYSLGQSVVHTLLIPASKRFLVTPAISQPLMSLENFAQKHRAIAAINGGFFDPENQKSTSYIVQQGVLVADPRQNQRLMNNPKLAPYMKQILNRTEFRRYRCGSTIRYDITLHSEPSPSSCQLLDALGGGPRLLPELTLVQEGFLDVAHGKVIRDPLGYEESKPRSAIGITRDGSVFVVMVAQKPNASIASGISLTALATFMKAQGVEKAMNLDGGSSSGFYYKGKTIYGQVDGKGKRVKRELFSVLLIQ